MRLKPFLLDTWLDQYEHGIEFNLAASTGPTWTVNDILALTDKETRHRFLNHKLVYSRPAGADTLREAIAEMQDVPVDSVQVMTGASEALVAMMWLVNEPEPTSLCLFRDSPRSPRCPSRWALKRASIACAARINSASTWTKSSVLPTRTPSSSSSTAQTIRRARLSATPIWKSCTTSPPSVAFSS